jgi:hypothetical protein
LAIKGESKGEVFMKGYIIREWEYFCGELARTYKKVFADKAKADQFLKEYNENLETERKFSRLCHACDFGNCDEETIINKNKAEIISQNCKNPKKDIFKDDQGDCYYCRQFWNYRDAEDIDEADIEEVEIEL